MFSKIKPFLTPPMFADEDKTRTANLLNTILLTIMAAAVLFGVPLPILAPAQLYLLPIAILIFLMAGGLLGLVHRGYVRFASLSLSIALLVIVTLIIVNDGGVRAPSFSAYILLIVITSLLSGGRAGIGFAIISTITGLGLVYAENVQLLSPLAARHSLVFIWLSHSVFFFITATILHRATNNLHNGLDRAQRSEEKYRALVENMSEGLIQADLKGTIQFVNRRMCQMVDYNPEELTGQNVGFLYSKDNQKVIPEKIELRKRGLTDKYETQMRRKSHDEIWVSVSGTPITNERGLVVGSLGIITDITELKQREQALAESELHYRSLFEGSPIALWEQDFSAIKTFIEELRHEGVNDFRAYFENHPEAVRRCAQFVKTIDLNQAAIELYQAKNKAEFFDGLDKIFREDSYPMFQEQLLAIVEDKSRFKIGTVNYTLTGDRRYIDLSWTVFPGYENTFARVIVSIIDVTEQKQLEEQLRQSQKMEAIGRLAGGIAHDFNNILTVIIGNSELALLRLQESDSLYLEIKQISKMAERAASLTSQLLAFSRQQVLQPKALNLNNVVGDMDGMLRRLIGEHIELKTVLDAELATIKADQGQLEQVILNLAINARDVMPHGGKLTIETANVELSQAYAQQHVDVEPGPYVMLAISDTGGGMDEQTQDNIFEPFFTTKEQGKGTGLGLAMVHGIIAQSGGHIKVYSQLGHSTTFKIYLPQAETGIQTTEQRHPTTKTARTGETILLVEDEDSVRDITNQILRENGYMVLEAGNGKEALQLVEAYTRPIHLLLTDVLMPGGMSGRQLAEQLVSRHREMKVLYMSGYTDNVIAHHGVLDPNTAFMQKPFTPETLLYKVREVLDD